MPHLLLLCLVFWAGNALAQAFDHEHTTWDGLLKKHVLLLDGGRASRLRYAGMAQDHAALKGYLEKISSVKEAQFERWTREQQEAFLINAYNAFTVEKVLTRYPDGIKGQAFFQKDVREGVPDWLETVPLASKT